MAPKPDEDLAHRGEKVADPPVLVKLPAPPLREELEPIREEVKEGTEVRNPPAKVDSLISVPQRDILSPSEMGIRLDSIVSGLLFSSQETIEVFQNSILKVYSAAPFELSHNIFYKTNVQIVQILDKVLRRVPELQEFYRKSQHHLAQLRQAFASCLCESGGVNTVSKILQIQTHVSLDILRKTIETVKEFFPKIIKNYPSLNLCPGTGFEPLISYTYKTKPVTKIDSSSLSEAKSPDVPKSSTDIAKRSNNWLHVKIAHHIHAIQQQNEQREAGFYLREESKDPHDREESKEDYYREKFKESPPSFLLSRSQKKERSFIRFLDAQRESPSDDNNKEEDANTKVERLMKM